ncbi:MAG: hydrogenase maturation protease [Anaerolineae bacterium]
MKTLILGLGNPILTDDAVGFVVAQEVRKRLDKGNVSVSEASVGGLSLLELVVGYDRVIMIDAIQTGSREPGAIHRFSADEFHGSVRSASTHDVSLASALELGYQLRMDIPKEIVIFGIEAADVDTFGEKLTPSVAAAVPRVVELVLQELARQSHDAPGLLLDCTFDTLLQYVTKLLRGIQRLPGGKSLLSVRPLDSSNTPPSISRKG